MDLKPQRSKFLKKYTLKEEDQQLISILTGIVEGYQTSVGTSNKKKDNAGDFLQKVEPTAFKKEKTG